MGYLTFYNMFSDGLSEMQQRKEKAQAAADSAAARSAAAASRLEMIKTELLGADRLVASSGAAGSIQLKKLKQPWCLAAAEQLARTIKTE